MNISIQNVSKIYKLNKQNEVTALKDISMEIRQEITALYAGFPVQGNLHCCICLVCLISQVQEESCLIMTIREFGASQSGRSSEMRISVTCFRDYALIPYRTVEENLRFRCISRIPHEKSFRSGLKKALEATGVDDLVKRRVNSLSGGQMQRVAIARALINEPKLILADEPTGALDSDNKEAVIKLFKGINDTGISIVVVTHDADVAASAGKCFQIKDGRFLMNHNRNKMFAVGLLVFSVIITSCSLKQKQLR